MNHLYYPTVKLILKGTPEELASPNAKKVVLIATKANLPIVCETVTAEECKQLSSHWEKSLVLLVGGGGKDEDDEEEEATISVATSRAMMRTIASMANPAIGLLGTSVVDEAMIDGWLAFIWTSIEIPLQAALALEEKRSDTATAAAAEEKAGIETDLEIALKKVETHLLKLKSSCCCRDENNNNHHPVYNMVTTTAKSYTLADFSLAVTLRYMLDNNIATSVMTSDENPQLYKWYQTIIQNKALDLQ